MEPAKRFQQSCVQNYDETIPSKYAKIIQVMTSNTWIFLTISVRQRLKIPTINTINNNNPSPGFFGPDQQGLHSVQQSVFHEDHKISPSLITSCYEMCPMLAHKYKAWASQTLQVLPKMVIKINMQSSNFCVRMGNKPTQIFRP